MLTSEGGSLPATEGSETNSNKSIFEGDVHIFNLASESLICNLLASFISDILPEASLAALIEHLARCAMFPKLSARDIIAGARAAGVTLTAGRTDVRGLRSLGRPALAYLRSPSHPIETLVWVRHCEAESLCVAEAGADLANMKLDDFAVRWNGVVIIPEAVSVEGKGSGGELSERLRFLDGLHRIPGLLSPAECDLALDEIKRNAFQASTLLGGSVAKAENVIKPGLRSSYTQYLSREDFSLYDAILDRCAVSIGHVRDEFEMIQCVRYAPGQQFKPHFDTSSKLRRSKTVLIYLNDDIEGGETHFPLLGRKYSPSKGDGLTFSNIDDRGRVLWFSQHAGLPVIKGTKYALNIWSR